MPFDISQFASYRENNRLEVKSANGGLPRSLWDTYSAFANCQGGVIILGVKEKADGSWKTTGLTNEAALLKDFWNTINNPGKVSANLLSDDDVETHTMPNGDVILIIRVPRAKRELKPIFVERDMYSGTYRRNGEGDYHCTKDEVRAMVRDSFNEALDAQVIESQSIEDLDMDAVHGYRNLHAAWKSEHVWTKLTDAEYLERIGAAQFTKSDQQYHPTVAGLLLFGQEYKITQVFPEYFLDYREMLDPTIRWTDRVVSVGGDWSGNLFDFFFRVNKRLVRDVKVPFKLEGIFRVDDTPVHKAIREALANCFANADFNIRRGIVIKKEGDVIIIENPGCIRTGKEQMLKGGISDPRNATIMKILNLVGIGERAGSGVPDILAVWEAEGWKKPEVQEQYDPDRTILTLTLAKEHFADNRQNGIGENKSAKSVGGNVPESKMQRQMAELLVFMQSEKEYTVQELNEALALKSSRARDLLRELVRQGKLEALGNTRNRRYVKPASRSKQND